MAKSKSKSKTRPQPGTTLHSLVKVIDARPLAKASRLRCGPLHARGVPSILAGVALIVLAAGAGAALRKSATMLPETLRGARELWLAMRGPRRELPG